jgi:SAM-dependent methyltransferase
MKMLGEFFIIKRRTSNLLRGKFKDNDIILDIGCGESPYYHQSIDAKIIRADINKTKKVDIVCDAMELPFKKSRFDGIVCINSLYYCSDPFKAINEIYDVIKKNGKLILITPFIYPIHDAPIDKYRFTEYGIKELLKNYFIIKEIRTIGGIFNLPSIFFHSLIKGVPLVVPNKMKKITKFLTVIILYPFYLVAQLISLLDVLDKTGRWTTYYFVVAVKK